VGDEFGQAVGWVGWDSGEHVAQVLEGINLVPFARLRDRVQHRGRLATRVASRE